MNQPAPFSMVHSGAVYLQSWKKPAPCGEDTNRGFTPLWMRSYAAPLGRWLTPDPAGLAAVDPNDPQSWNRYAYVANHPLALADPFGLNPGDLNGCSTSAGTVTCNATMTVTGSAPSTDNGFDPPYVYIGPGNSPGGGGASPTRPQTTPNNNKQLQQDCLNQYNNSVGGKAVQFLSLYNLATNVGSLKTWAEWTALPYLKIQAVNLLNKASQVIGNTEFWSITAGAATPTATVLSPTAAGISTTESVGAVAAPIAIGAATIVDIQVHAACAGITPQVELAPTVF